MKVHENQTPNYLNNDIEKTLLLIRLFMKRKIRIKLISPKMSLRPMDSEVKRRMAPSLTLIILASLTPEPHIVYIEDENINPIDYSDKPDLVGITVNVDTIYIYRAIEISGKYRSNHDHIETFSRTLNG